MTNRKSTSSYPMSLNAGTYCPCSRPVNTVHGCDKRQPCNKTRSKTRSDFFRIKVDFCRRKSATKFLCVKTVSGKVVRPLYNSAQMVGGGHSLTPLEAWT